MHRRFIGDLIILINIIFKRKKKNSLYLQYYLLTYIVFDNLKLPNLARIENFYSNKLLSTRLF